MSPEALDWSAASSHSHELLPQAVYEQLPRFEEIQRDWGQHALIKFYVLDDRYWSFYVSSLDRQGDLFGIEVSPEGFTFATFPLGEFERVNAELDIKIKRDAAFEPKPFREIVQGYLADAGSQAEKPAEPVSNSVSATVASPEHSSQTQFLVDYSLSSSMPVHATAEAEASEQAFATLHDLIGQAELFGVPIRVANHVRLGHAEIAIDGVEVVPPGREVIQTPPPDLFEITAVSRDDLAASGFDASQVSDEAMETLARKMADDYVEQLFWLSLKLNAETLGFPKRS